MSTCEHRQFQASVNVNRLEDSGRFMADVAIVCEECGLPFSFLGLPPGVDMEGATVSIDGTEGRFALTHRPTQSRRCVRRRDLVLHDQS